MPQPKSPDRPKPGSVRALTRGLDILRHVNAQGACKVGDIARSLNIPRPTVYRLLETLEQQGYVAFSPHSALVRVTRLAASLGDGYAATTALCQIAGPLFAARADRIVWPLDLTVYEDAAMVIQETTHNRNPLSIDTGMTGYRLPMLRSSAGRCYLAFCPPGEQEMIIRHLRRLDDPEDRPFARAPALADVLARTRADGYGARYGPEFRPKTASIAVPVMSEGRVLCCVSVIWTRAAMTKDQAVSRLLPAMQDLAADLARAVDTGTHS